MALVHASTCMASNFVANQSFKTIVTTTSNFSDSNVIGEGGFGKVYKGILENGDAIAVKRESVKHEGMKDLEKEVSLIAKLQHRNLVRVIGYCSHGEEDLLIYEYLPNMSLDVILFGTFYHLNLFDWQSILL
jgi:serine/threonine protein kinase